MKILFLSNNEITDALFHWLAAEKENVMYYNKKISADDILKWDIEFIISYNYCFLLKDEVIQLLPHKVINLHTSYLPWNRGASPNIWAFIEGTPCGVTIHEIDQGLDTGDILVQSRLEFDFEKETLRSSYEKSHEAIQQLFQENWNAIKAGTLIPVKQQGKGSFHFKKQADAFGHLINYDDTICTFLKKVKKNYGEIIYPFRRE